MTDLHHLSEQINNVLPQTQCTQCGYDGCAPYAHAIAFDGVNINQCPPGGQKGIAALARITGRQILPLNPNNGVEQPLRVAQIVEAECIGCTKCIQACPVDAIIGTSKFMHTVLTDLCTGCELCVPPCPVDCIEMPQAETDEWTHTDAQAARTRFEMRNQRLLREQHELNEKRIQKNELKLMTVNEDEHKLSIVEAALARARARRGN